MKKAFIISACLITIIVIVSIIISVSNLKPATYKSVVSYDEKTNIIDKAPSSSVSTATNDDLSFLNNLLKYEKTIMVSTLFIVILFALLFYGTKRSKGW